MTDANGSENKSSQSIIDNVLDYYRERIESPFLMSFLVSWSVINRDFLFYLFLSEDKDKYVKLTQWDFSSFFAFWYLSCSDSLIYPFLYGVLITLFFNPMSMTLSGLRYYVSTRSSSFAQSAKENYEEALKKAKLETLILVLQNKYDALETKFSSKTADLESIESDVENREMDLKVLDSKIENINLTDFLLRVLTAYGMIRDYLTHPDGYVFKTVDDYGGVFLETRMNVRIINKENHIVYERNGIFVAEFVVDNSIFGFDSEGKAGNARHFTQIIRVGVAEQLDTKFGVTKIIITNAETLLKSD